MVEVRIAYERPSGKRPSATLAVSSEFDRPSMITTFPFFQYTVTAVLAG